MKQPKPAVMKQALTEIAGMKGELASMSTDDALAAVVDIALAALDTKQGPSALELKTKEVADFVMKDFALVFSTNDEICETLNAAGIKSPTGKEWSRSNVSKIMVGVKEIIVAANTAKAADPADVPVEAAPDVSEPVTAPEPDLTPETAEIEPVAETEPGELSAEDALMAELDELDELDELALAS